MSKLYQPPSVELSVWLTSPQEQAETAAVIDKLARLCSAMSERKGFQKMQHEMQDWLRQAPVHLRNHYTTYSKLAELMLQVSELGEAAEAVRKPGPSEHIPPFSGWIEEEADAVVRVADSAGRREESLGQAVVAKMLFNAGRPHMHGKQA